MKTLNISLAAAGMAVAAAAVIPALYTRQTRLQSLEPRTEENEPSYLETNAFQAMLRGWPTGKIDTKAYAKAAAIPKGAVITDGVSPWWEYVGPKNNPGTSGMYYGPGPISGRVNAIAFGALSSIYITSPGGGVHESTDNGVTWKPLSDAWESMNTTAIAVKPNNTNSMLVGTGDYHGLLDTGGIGVMKGTLSAGSWSWTIKGAAQANGRAISKILYDPENPNIVLMTTGRGAGITRNGAGQITNEGAGGVFRSTNAGDTWTIVVGSAAADQRPWNNVVCGAMSPTTGRRLYYAVGNGVGTVLLRSSDKGVTWKAVPGSPLGFGGGSLAGLDVATSPTEPETVYLLSAVDRRIWKSKNGGNKWSTMVSPASLAGFPFHDSAGDNYNFSQRHYDWFIQCGSHPDPANNNEPMDDVYVGLITVAHSPDAGNTWSDIGLTYRSGAKTHNDQQCMAFKPGAGYLNPYLGNDGGIYKLTYDPAGPTFTFDQSLNKDLYITQFYKADWDADTPESDTILGGTQDNGTPWSNASPPAWQPNKPFGDGSGSAIGRTVANPQNRQFAGGYQSGGSFSFLSTTDWWVTGAVMDNCAMGGAGLTFPPLSCDPNNPRFAYSGFTQLWMYDANLVAVRTNVTAGANNATQTVGSTAGMVVGMSLRFGDPNTGATYPPVQITAIPNATTVTVNAVLNTTAGSWSVESGSGWALTSPKVLGDMLTSVAVARTDSNLIFTGARNGKMWYSTDAGTTVGNWTDVSFNLPSRPVSDIAFSPGFLRECWVTLQGNTTPFRVARLSRPVVGPPTWLPMSGAGLPDVPANCIAVDPDVPNSRLYVGTDMGLYYTIDGGANWKHANAEATIPMPYNVRVTDVEVTGTGPGKKLNCSTFGRGIWRVNASDLH